MLPDIAAGVRAAVAMVVPLALSVPLQIPELRISSLGGWLAALSDPGGSRVKRAQVIAGFALASGCAVAATESLAGIPGAAVVALTGIAFIVSWLRVLGEPVASVGTLLLVISAIGVTHPSPHPLRDGVFLALGAVWALVGSTIIWPVWPHLPLRRAVSVVYYRLAQYARSIEAGAAAGWADGGAEWTRLAHERQSRVRVALEDALQTAVASRSRRSGESAVGVNLRLLFGHAEAQFPLLIALSEELETHQIRQCPQLRLCAEENDAIAARVLDLRRRPVLGPEPGEHEASIAGRLFRVARDARHVASHLSVASGVTRTIAEEEQAPAPDRFALLTAALSPRSVDFRHALRVAVAAAMSGSVGAIFVPEHAQWVTVTTLVLLQPYPGATARRALERVVGTFFGALLAIALASAVHSHVLLVTCTAPLCVLAVATKSRSYRLFTFFLTPVFVLIADPGITDTNTAVARMVATLVGALVAVCAAFLVFPSWEKQRMPEALAATLETLRSYTEFVLESSLRARSRDDEAKALGQRRAVGRALREADVCLERLLAEPRMLPSSRGAQRAMLDITFARRYAAALTTLHTHLAAHPDARLSPAAVQAALSFVHRAVFAGQPTPPPELRGLSAPFDADLQRLIRGAERLSIHDSEWRQQR